MLYKSALAFTGSIIAGLGIGLIIGAIVTLLLKTQSAVISIC